MRCPKCQRSGRGQVRTLDSRDVQGGQVVRRRRACACGHRWTTFELEADACRQLRYLAKVGARYRRGGVIAGLGGRWAG